MTVTRGPTLLVLFRSKIEEAVSFVPRMCAEEKLKAVQFWNIVSEKLQEIINNSAADINAVTLKLDEENAEKNSLENTSGIILQNFTVDFMNLSANYSGSTGSTVQYQNDDISNHLKQFLSTTSSLMNFTDQLHPAAISNVSSTGDFNATKQFQEASKTENAFCDQMLNVKSPAANICDTYISDSHPSAEMPSALSDVQSDKCPANVSVQDKTEPQQKVKTGKKAKRLTAIKKSSLAVNSHVKNDDCNNFENQNQCKDICTAFPGIGENSPDSFQDFDSIDSEDSNLRENIVGFVVSNSEEIIAKNDVMLDMTNKETLKNVNFCQKCDTQFFDCESFSSHQCDTSRPFSCSECKAKFSTKGNLIVHLRKHTGEKPYSCNKCSSSFSTKGNLKRHLKTHSGEKPWQCNRCGGRFTEKKSLTVHMRRHTGERPYQCKVCGKKFAQSGILQTHMAMHLDQKFHLCEHCGKSFRQKSQLRIHKLRHENVRKFSCGSCSSRFLTKGDLERHLRTHTGERPFVCDICSKSFTRQQSLNEHTNRHYGLKPYSCKYCGRGFSEMSACYKHVKLHERLKIDGETDDLQNETEKSEQHHEQLERSNEVNVSPNESSEIEQHVIQSGSNVDAPELSDEVNKIQQCSGAETESMQLVKGNYEDKPPDASEEEPKYFAFHLNTKSDEEGNERPMSTPFIHTFLE